MRFVFGFLLCLAVLAASPAYAGSGDTTSGLIGHWAFDEGTGTTAADLSGFGADMTLEEGAVWAPGIVGSHALENSGGGGGGLTAATGCCAAADHLDPGTSDFSVCYWRKDRIPNSSWEIHVNKKHDQPGGWNVGKSSSGNIFSLKFNDGGTAFTYLHYDISAISGTGTWNHFCTTADRDGLATLYLDGEQVATDDISAKSALDLDALGGMSLVATPFIDEVRVYNRVLAPDDVTALYVRSDKYCDSPTDAPGIIRYNADRSALQYCDGKNWVMMGLGSYTPVGAAFDGTNDQLVHRGNFTGVTDTPKATGSFWVRRHSIGVGQDVFDSSSGSAENFRLLFKTNDTFSLVSEITDPTRILNAQTSATITDNDWHHILFSIDLSDTGKRHVYIDGGDAATSFFQYDTSAQFPLTTGTNFSVGSNTTGTIKSDIDLADLWIDFGTYIDFSSAALREKFISANGMPMYLGPDGSLPTGWAPDVFLSGDVADWHTNKGTGGGFTETGALTEALSHPGGNLTLGNCPNIGDICDDGSVYAGLSPAGNMPLYTTPADAGDVAWNNGNSSGLVDTSLANCIDDTPGTADTCQTGKSNTATLITIDSDNATGGTQVHGAAQVCADAPDHGHDDWYLPALDELAVLYDNHVAIGNFDLSGTYPWGYYWASSEYDDTNARGQRFSDGTQGEMNKFDTLMVRCVRTGGCNNPTGAQGTIIYNIDYKVMQYCNGVDWVAMSKGGSTGGGGCASPAGVTGEMIYNADFKVMQYCNSEDWVAIGKDPENPCTGTPSPPSPGDLCQDGSYYIGQVGGNDIYATDSASESNQTWNNGTSNWTDTGFTSTTDGPGNTAGLVALSDAGAPYDAAEYCDGLTNVHGHSDWYLPAVDELNLFWNGGTPVAGVNTGGSWYWSSTENFNSVAWIQRFSDGTKSYDGKYTTYLLRCVRR